MSKSIFARLTVFCFSVALVTGIGWVFPDDSEARRVRNRTRVNVNRDVHRDVHREVHRDVHRDIDIDVDVDYHRRRYPVAAAAAATAVTAAAIGSIVYSLPPSCRTVNYNGFVYQECGDVWYQPQYAGDQITYVVINPPY